MIAIIDYGVGNLFSLQASLNFIGAEAKVTGDREEIEKARKIILPGVGAFGDAREKLRETGMDRLVVSEAEKGKPLLGICLGMQLLFEESLEFGRCEGLGLIKGQVASIQEDLPADSGLKVPHMGWNKLQFTKEAPIFKNTKEGSSVYFVHSFYGKNCDEALIATAEYGITVTAAVRNKNVYGTQFHPEKSGPVGLDILRAFNEI